MTLTAAVVAVGDELLIGDTVNTNASWLGGQLAAAGVQVVASAMVGDDLARLAVVLRRALEDADVVLVTGGLGPTSDDITRDAVSAAAGVVMDRVPELEDELRGSLADLREHLEPLAVVAYPNGDHDASVCAAARASGYALAYTTLKGRNGAGTDPHALRRVSVHAADGALAVLWKAVTGEGLPGWWLRARRG